MSKPLPDAHDLLAAERFLAAEARIAASFERTEDAIAPVLRGMRATGRITYATDPERGAIWGHAFLRPPYAPSLKADWFVAWGIRFPDGGHGWDGAEPALPRVPHAIVAVGDHGRFPPAPDAPMDRAGWSRLTGDAAFLAAGIPLHALPPEGEALAAALAAWTRARIEELDEFLPAIAGA